MSNFKIEFNKFSDIPIPYLSYTPNSVAQRHIIFACTSPWGVLLI